MNKKLISTVLLSVICSICAARPAYAADFVWGLWTNKERTYGYEFLKKNEFNLWVKKDTAVEIPNFSPNTARHAKESTIHIYGPVKTEGVWQFDSGICWLGDKKQQTGNLMIYVDTLQCCLLAQFVGNKLLLSEIWRKGFDEQAICTNRVLVKSKSMQDE